MVVTHQVRCERSGHSIDILVRDVDQHTWAIEVQGSLSLSVCLSVCLSLSLTHTHTHIARVTENLARPLAKDIRGTELPGVGSKLRDGLKLNVASIAETRATAGQSGLAAAQLVDGIE